MVGLGVLLSQFLLWDLNNNSNSQMIYTSGRAKKKKKACYILCGKCYLLNENICVLLTVKICLLPSDQVQEPVSNFLIYVNQLFPNWRFFS